LKADTIIIPLKGFSDSQKLVIEETFNEIYLIKTGKLAIPAGIYKKHSRFKSLFGFKLDGALLVEWLYKRIETLEFRNSMFDAVNNGDGTVYIGNSFFSSTPVERIYILVHEARHSDGDSFPHIKCPPDHPYVLPDRTGFDLANKPACDDQSNGAYGYQAALLFELYAFGLYQQTVTGKLYNSTVTRIIRK